jgi:serine/threonine-protein kinase
MVDNRYTLLDELGSGGAGEVFLAKDEVLGREVALKMLGRHREAEPGIVERFEREARSTASLSHPNVVAVHDLGELPPSEASGARGLYIVMEYVPGITLADLIRERSPLEPGVALSISLRAARGLDAAHARDIIHRDVKPANVLLANPSGGDLYSGAPEVVKVTDFGISRRLSDSTLTEQNAVIGTAHYLSPEQALGQNVDLRSDLYSLGAVLYEMLTGKRPFETGEDESPLAVAMRHVNQDPASPSSVNPDIPPELDRLTLSLLGKDPEERPESASELADALEAGLSSGPGAEAESFAPGAAAASGGAGGSTPPPNGPPGEDSESGYGGDPGGRATRRGLLRYALPAVLLILLLTLAVGAVTRVGLPEISGGGGSQGESVEVPDVEGASLEEARRLAGDEVALEVTGRRASEVPEDTVLSADPQSGQRVERGATVELVVSDGPHAVDTTKEKTSKEVSRVENIRFSVDEYYEAVKRWDWSYTYDHLDSRTQDMFSQTEWYRKNQHIAETDDIILKSRDIEVLSVSDSGDYAVVNVYRTFESGVVIDRNTVFVYESGKWRHRLVGEELVFFMPDASIERFKKFY